MGSEGEKIHAGFILHSRIPHKVKNAGVRIFPFRDSFYFRFIICFKRVIVFTITLIF